MLDLSTFLTPLLAFGGALLGVVLNRRGARELERRSLREETMRNVRWAAELAVAEEPGRAVLGVDQLDALRHLPTLERYERSMVMAAVGSIEPHPRRGEES